MKSSNLRQKELAARLGIDATTLNNFLNRKSKSLGGLPVALACTLVDLTCDGKTIGIVRRDQIERPGRTRGEEQLVLEFDGTFELMRESKNPTLFVRRPTSQQGSIRLAIRNVV